MINDNFSPFNEIPKKNWKKYKISERRFIKMDNEICQIATDGHEGEIKAIFQVVIESEISTEYQRKLTQIILDRYELTDEISTNDLLRVQAWYSKIISSQVSAAIKENLNTGESFDNVISLEEEDGK